MAVDKLVDSTQLDACCTAEANAIRAKTGGSAQLAYDWANNKGFADAIAAIPSGGGKTLTKLSDVTVSSAVAEVIVPITDDIKNCESLYLCWSGVSLSASDWLAITLNSTTVFHQTKSQTPANNIGRLCISPPTTINGTSEHGKPVISEPFKQFSVSVNIDNGITAFKWQCWTGGVNITAGHFEIWGWI